MLLSIRGSGIAGSGMPNTIVLINSIVTPIISMNDSEIRVIAPSNLHTALPARVTAVYNGAIVATADVAASASAPGLFDPANNATNPAPRGSTISLFGTGIGLGDLPVSVTLGGVTASVVLVNTATGYPGLFRIDAQVPTSIPAGSTAVVVAVGAATSQSGLQLTVN